MTDYIKLQEDLKTLLGKNGLSDSYINLNLDFIKIAQKTSEQILEDKSINPSLPTSKEVNQNFSKGIPAIIFCPPKLPYKMLRKHFLKTTTVLKNSGIFPEEIREAIKNTENKKEVRNLLFSCLIFDLEKIGELSEILKIDPGTLLLAANETLKPFLREYANQIKTKVSFSDWTKGYCPICASQPTFSKFSKKEDGLRQLWCGRCDTEWSFQRLVCPSCNCSDHKKLKVISAENHEEYRINICKKCKGYVKGIDERKASRIESICYPKEDLATLYLDVIAEQEKLVVRFSDKLQIPEEDCLYE